MRVARVAGVVATGLLGVAGALLAVLLARGDATPVNELAILLVVSAYAAVAVLLGVARPGHPVGRLLLVGVVVWGVGEGLLALAVRAVAEDVLGVAGWLGTLGTTARGLGWLTLVLGLPLLFPDGRLPWRDRRPLALPLAAAGIFTLGSVLSAEPLDHRLDGIPSPTGLPAGMSVLADVLALLGLALIAAALVLAVATLARRWRAGGELLRQQVLWFSLAFAAPLLLVPFIPAQFVQPWMFAVVTLPVPAAIAVALFQRRLYDLQLVVNRTVTYVVLSAVVAGLYAATVGGVGALLRDTGADWLPWVAAGVVAVTFAPLRNGLQAAVNRLTYGQWSQPAEVLAATGRRLSDAADVPGLLATLTTELGEGLGLDCVEIRDASGSRLAVHGSPQPVSDETSLTAYGQVVGTLRWGPPRLRAADRRLLDDLAGQIGGVVHAAGLVEDLRSAQERLVLAREEERRRMRRDLHDGLGPALAGLTLQVDTVRNVLATGADADDELLRLRGGIVTTVLDVRRVVEGLRPPALDELGLDGALHQLAERVTSGSDVRIDVSTPPTLPRIPAAIEVAAYRVTQEALSNAVRHSGATRSQVQLRLAGDALCLSVTDNGSGRVRPRAGGIGLTTMHERAAEIGGRLSIESADACGTTVVLRLPLQRGGTR